VIVLENESKQMEPMRTSEGKYKCRKDNQEYDNKEDYETHCKEEHDM
jgi:hypothetical protein